MSEAPPRSVMQRIRAAVRAWLVSDEPPEWFLRSRGVSSPAMSGVTVTDETAMRVTAVLSCVKVIAESISTLPLVVFERQANGDRRPVPEHPLSQLLHSLSNDETTAQTMRETKLAHLLLRGNAVSRTVRDGAGDVREIWNLTPGTYRIAREREQPNGRLVVHLSETGVRPETLTPGQYWRIAGLSWNGCTGLSPIGLARESFGLALALEQTAATTLKNGARLGGVVEHPTTMKDDEYERFKRTWGEVYEGVTNAGKTAILEGNAKWTKVGMTFDDLKFIDLRKFQVTEIARVFRVPLHKLYDDKAQPRANMEQAALEFVVDTLRQWLVRFEQTISRDLLLPSERLRYFAEHNVAGLLRGDFKSRMEGYAIGRQWGWLSVNDVLRLENRNGIGPAGDRYIEPMNMRPAGEDPQED